VVYSNVLKLMYLLYADDLALFSSSPIGLQRLLNRLAEYCDKWRLTVNLKKSKIIVFRKGGRLKHSENWVWKGSKIEVVSKYNYLGVIFSSSGIWYQAQKYISDQAKKALYSLQKLLYKFSGLKINIAFKIFDCKILPILLYGSAVWGIHTCIDIEKAHNKFCKFILGVNTTTNNCAARGELGRLPMRMNIDIEIIRFWLKCIHIDSPVIVKDCYQYQYTRANMGLKCWGFYVKNLLNSYGFGALWVNQQVENSELFLQDFKQRSIDIASQMWHTEIVDCPKLRTYCKFKVCLKREKYLDCIPNTIFKKALARFRVSSHDLYIESGRRMGLPTTQRLCPFGCNQIEDEFHFLLICPIYVGFRNTFIPKFYFSPALEWKFIALLMNENQETLDKLGKYIFHSERLRKTLMG